MLNRPVNILGEAVIAAFWLGMMRLAVAQAGPQLAVGDAKADRTNSGPRIEFAETTHDFGRVESGKAVQFEFAFTNTGNQVLEIKNVASSCGCTTLGEPTRRVEPGKSGIIPIVFNTTGFSGPTMKHLTLACNDPQQTNVILNFKATIWKPIDALPGIASFYFGPDFQTNQTRVIRLVSNLEESVTLSEPVLTNKLFHAELKTVQEGKEFELRVTVVPPLPGGGSLSTITIPTSSTNMPEVTVSAYAMVQPALTISPSYVALPPGALDKQTKYSVTIQSRSTNALSLSTPTLAVQGADVQLTELTPGKEFKLDLTFPAGFKASAGRFAEVAVKCNHPQSPTIKVPIFRKAEPDEGGRASEGGFDREQPPPGTLSPPANPLTTQK